MSQQLMFKEYDSFFLMINAASDKINLIEYNLAENILR